MNHSRLPLLSAASPVLTSLLAVLTLTADEAEAQIGQRRSDFVFVIDDSASMGNEIRALRDALPAFVQSLQANNIDHRFALAKFGDEPRLLVDITNDTAAIQSALDSLTTPIVRREAGLEAIRMVLGESAAPLTGGPIHYRPNTIRNLILITDEDSDQPHFPANRLPGQSCTRNGVPDPDPFRCQNSEVQPPTGAWSTNSDWQQEIDDTVAAILRHDVLVNLLVKVSGNLSGQTVHQYGDWRVEVTDPATGSYLRPATYAALQAAGLGHCLQAQLLQRGRLCRTFDIDGFRPNNPTFVNGFFQTKLEETLCPCAAGATWSRYGQGTPGTGGVAPGISLSALPSVCQPIDLVVGNPTGAPTACCVLLSDLPADRLTSFGARLLVEDQSPGFLEAGFVLGAQSGRAPLQIPCNSLALCGLTYYLQAAVLDANAPSGIAASEGLELVIGN